MYLPELVVKDSLFDPDAAQPIAQWRNPQSDSPYYRVFLYLDGTRLPYINAVTYVLHQSFDNPTRQVVRTPANPHCKLELWTWGVFQIQAVVTDQQGTMLTLSHDLQYNKEFPSVKFVEAPQATA
jgi:transcription initiation factor IIF auxiliary subunit